MDPCIVIVPKRVGHLPLAPQVKADDPAQRLIADRVALARREHLETLAIVREAVATWEHVHWVETPTPRDIDWADLVVTVGGDGTFLMAARHCTQAPIVGLNSSPSTSTGNYCAILPDRFADWISAWRQGRYTPQPLTRLRIHIDGHPVGHDALNDVLFANRTPVSSTRYALTIGDHTEIQTSSGLWFSTATGSTAAIHSAGGQPMPPDDPRIQWLVREPYLGQGDDLRLLHGFAETSVTLTSRSDKNTIYLDGHPAAYSVTNGMRAVIGRSPIPLQAYLKAAPTPD